jgi:hypothetical protein
MTLIASFEFQHVPILVGDMLITSRGAPTKESHTPLVHTPNKIIGIEGARYVSSLRQKLAILHDHVCLAWANDLFHAQRFAEYIRSFASGMVSIDYDELRRTIDAYPREDLEGHLEFVIYAWHGTGWGYFSNLKPFDLDPLRQMRVSGTGTTHFIANIEHVAKGSIIGNLDAYTQLATRALAYASLASAQQFFSGVGLNEWWGGGFEVVVFRDGRLTKLGPICWLYWECAEIAEQHYSLNLKPSFMYQFYVGDTAMFWIDEDLEGTNKIHSVAPPFRTADQPLRRPDTFETDIVVNLVRLQTLTGETNEGCSVDMSAGPDKRDLIMTWSKGDGKTTLGIKEGYIQRMLSSMPLPKDSAIDVHFWGNTLQFRASSLP